MHSDARAETDDPRVSARRDARTDGGGDPLRISRRAALGSAGAAGMLAALAQAGCGSGSTATSSPVLFFGEHQAGIATPAQDKLSFTALDFTSTSAMDLRDLLRVWTQAAAALTAGRTPPALTDLSGAATPDSLEALGLGSARLTITIGLGPGLFEQAGEDRLGLRARRPPALTPLPSLPGDELQPARSGGDLCIQACADDPQVAFHATHTLLRLAHGAAVARWSQVGFGRTSSTSRTQETPRNLMGFKDGTNNLKREDAGALQRHVWVGSSEAPAWMRGGTYLVARRIRILFDVWDATDLGGQERAIGRRKVSGAPLGAEREHDPVDLHATTANGPTIPMDAHIRLAAPETNGGIRILRRGYSYFDGADPDTGQIDAGLFFLSFQRDPQHFVALQRRLGVQDALAKHLSHTGSAIFAVPPGPRRGSFLGASLFG
ncbi:MAG: deferrochelatase/peroxidase EfeB [Actinobacteria bacterium]|nr:deferrochelatase/peroxidase EfeB [Actinomycetota bacterium]